MRNPPIGDLFPTDRYLSDSIPDWLNIAGMRNLPVPLFVSLKQTVSGIMSMQGKCLCGKVQFEVLGPIVNLYQCHCSLCRKQSGSASNTGMIVTEDKFRWLSPDAGISSWVKQTGFRSDFCSTCGSPVPNPLRGTTYWWIPAGLFETEIDSKIVTHIFVGSKASWDEISGAGSQHHLRPADEAFLKILHQDRT